MRETGIPFSEHNVRAILADRKHQTRRLVDPGKRLFRYGGPGDRLWVREAWRARRDQDHLPPRDLPRVQPWYCATGNGHGDEEPSGCAGGLGRKRPGMFMPRWASRITLVITEVRVERLQDITEADASDEGFTGEPMKAMINGKPGTLYPFNALHWFAITWDALNPKALWISNPWVSVIRFARVQ